MDVFGYAIPFWVVLLGIIGIVFLFWGVLKFAVWVLIIIVIAIFALIGLDFLLGIFQNIGL
jgi:hypothetical protein